MSARCCHVASEVGRSEPSAPFASRLPERLWSPTSRRRAWCSAWDCRSLFACACGVAADWHCLRAVGRNPGAVAGCQTWRTVCAQITAGRPARHHSFGARRWRSRARARAARPRARLCHAWRPAIAVCAAAAQRMARAAGVLMSQVRAPWEHALSAARATPTRATLVLAIQHPETACSNVDRHCFHARRLRDAKIRFVCLWLQRTYSRRFLGTHGICSRVWAFAGLIFSPNSRLAT